jgi:hypothetical protein
VPVSFEKIEKQAPGLVSLAKAADQAVQATKLPAGHVAKVALTIDCSGSMSGLFWSGEVQRIAERVLALATRLDDDGDIEVFAFGSGARYVGTINLSNYQGAVRSMGIDANMGGTNYEAAIREVLKHYGFGGGALSRFRKADRAVPVYNLFLTDGDPTSGHAEKALIDASAHPMFVQFIALGRGPFPTLQGLDSMPGRVLDNADCVEAEDGIDGVPDEAVFAAMMGEYPQWVLDATTKGILR